MKRRRLMLAMRLREPIRRHAPQAVARDRREQRAVAVRELARRTRATIDLEQGAQALLACTRHQARQLLHQRLVGDRLVQLLERRSQKEIELIAIRADEQRYLGTRAARERFVER
jgi:hypothetical protein